jgi:hypothetical protein
MIDNYIILNIWGRVMLFRRMDYDVGVERETLALIDLKKN